MINLRKNDDLQLICQSLEWLLILRFLLQSSYRLPPARSYRLPPTRWRRGESLQQNLEA